MGAGSPWTNRLMGGLVGISPFRGMTAQNHCRLSIDSYPSLNRPRYANRKQAMCHHPGMVTSDTPAAPP